MIMKILNYILLCLVVTSTTSHAFTVYNTITVPKGGEIHFTIRKDGKKEEVTMVFNHRMQRKKATIRDGNYSIDLELWVPNDKGDMECVDNLHGYQFLSDSYKFNIVMTTSYKTGAPMISYWGGWGQDLHSAFNLLNS
jgi:hypothetical protein